MRAADQVISIGANYYRFRDRNPVEPLLESRSSLQQWFASDLPSLKETDKLSAKLITVAGRCYFAKRYRPFPFIRRLAAEDRALKVYQVSIALEQAGLPVARALAYIREGHPLAPVASYLVCESLADMVDLQQLAATPAFGPLLATPDFFASIGRCLARLHQLGYCHGDLKWANIMVNTQTYEYKLVDLDGSRKTSAADSRLLIKDLARFVLNAREQRVPAPMIEHFVACYADERNLEPKLLQPKIELIYEKLRRRHRDQYGVDSE